MTLFLSNSSFHFCLFPRPRRQIGGNPSSLLGLCCSPDPGDRSEECPLPSLALAVPQTRATDRRKRLEVLWQQSWHCTLSPVLRTNHFYLVLVNICAFVYSNFFNVKVKKLYNKVNLLELELYLCVCSFEIWELEAVFCVCEGAAEKGHHITQNKRCAQSN